VDSASTSQEAARADGARAEGRDVREIPAFDPWMTGWFPFLAATEWMAPRKPARAQRWQRGQK
jgi:hypothetical protein